MTIENNLKEVRVSIKTDPKQLATSIIYSLQEGKKLRVVSIGEAIKNSAKGIALISNIKPKLNFKLKVRFEYAETTEGIKNVLVWYIEKEEN